MLVVALAFALLGDVDAPPVVRGVQAPAFELPALTGPGSNATPDGVRSELALADWTGRVVLVNFWATWCEPCTSEMPAMERLYQALPRDDFELVAVSIDDEAALVLDFQERFALSFPILLDEDQAVYREYQTMGVPESLLIDRSGRIVERYVGPREWDAAEYEQRIRALISGEGASTP